MSRHSQARLAVAALVALSAASCTISEGGTTTATAGGSVPYAGWVAFASALTYAIWQRNPTLLG